MHDCPDFDCKPQAAPCELCEVQRSTIKGQGIDEVAWLSISSVLNYSFTIIGCGLIDSGVIYSFHNHENVNER